jgi:hypothetical protein
MLAKTRTLGTDTTVDHLSLVNSSGEEDLTPCDGTQYFVNVTSTSTHPDPGVLSSLGINAPDAIQDIQVYFETKHHHARH